MYYVRHNYVYSRDKYALLGASGWRYSLPSCCNNSLYKLGFFLYDIAVDELLLDLFIFAFAKACWSFQQKMKEMVCPSLWCAILFYGTFFFSTFIRLIFSVLNVFAAENAMRVYT